MNQGFCFAKGQLVDCAPGRIQDCNIKRVKVCPLEKNKEAENEKGEGTKKLNFCCVKGELVE